MCPKIISIKSAMLNGSPLNKAWLNHSDIVNGGILEFEMDSVPNYNWGTSEVPHSLSDQI